MSQVSANLGSIASAIQAALAGGNTSLAAQLAGLFHSGATTNGLDYKNKTMTISWEQANQGTAPLLLAQGWTIIPG